MEAIWIFCALVVGVCSWTLFRTMVRRRRRQALLRAPFPPEWERILKSNLPPYKHLTAKLQNELKGLVNIFLDEKAFEGCGGLEITDEMRVIIAAEACLLLLNKHVTACFPSLDTVLVYPHAFIAKARMALDSATTGGGVVEDDELARIGESWGTGVVVLAWDHVKSGAADFADGQNVVLHEFGHQLDQASGSANGVPPLGSSTSYRSWATVLGREYDHLRDMAKHHKKDVIDAYGATNPAEFFAVATEVFFEKPSQMESKHPELFEQLMAYYRLDPREWT